MLFVLTSIIRMSNEAAERTAMNMQTKRKYVGPQLGICAHRIFGDEDHCGDRNAIEAIRILSGVGVTCFDVDVIMYVLKSKITCN